MMEKENGVIENAQGITIVTIKSLSNYNNAMLKNRKEIRFIKVS